MIYRAEPLRKDNYTIKKCIEADWREGRAGSPDVGYFFTSIHPYVEEIIVKIFVSNFMSPNLIAFFLACRRVWSYIGEQL